MIDGETWQIDGETMETVTDLILEGSKITANGDCSHERKRNKVGLRNIYQLLRSLEYTLFNNLFKKKKDKSLSYYYITPIVMYGCESWTIKKAEC